MTKPYSAAFKQRMVQKLIGKNAMTAVALARQTGIRQQNLSRWLIEARSLPNVAADKPKPVTRTVEQKALLIANAATLEGDRLTELLEREGVTLAELESWRLALDGRESSSRAMEKQVRTLERELRRKEKALAEAAALLILKKKLEDLYPEAEDDEPGDETEK